MTLDNLWGKPDKPPCDFAYQHTWGGNLEQLWEILHTISKDAENRV